MNTNKKGFTLIELLVVIVIIGILATISVATFGGYFKKARDAERQSAVQNIATIMKVLNATEETVNYSTDTSATGSDTRAKLDARLNVQGYATPDGKNQFGYIYSYDNSEDDFVIAACSEEDTSKIYSAGTPAGVAAASATTGTDGCKSTSNPKYPLVGNIDSDGHNDLTWYQ